MEMRFFNSVIEWVASWDFMAILYSVLGTLLVGVLLKWTGALRWLHSKYKMRRGLRAYKKSTLEECSSLIVIGRRKGFSIKDVFVTLDIAPSDLMGKTEDKPASPPKSYVLVGGPGAGKSTMAKKMVLDRLSQSEGCIPFFVRLREYGDAARVEDSLVQMLESNDIENAGSLVEATLRRGDCLCVLDGLDEVRPHIRHQVCDQINHFYQKYFSSRRGNALIVTCRKEAYRAIPLDIPSIWEVRPLTDQQIKRFAAKLPLTFPKGKSADTFWVDLVSTERILELARSPLLLVGGLMQYTESNLGIPDERIEYLARIGRWLVADWAIAQDHPPDPHRPVYKRILARLALDMHVSQESEYPTNKAVKLIREWLPDYGFQKEEAEAFLQDLVTKTGILVRNVPGSVVFAQFALQEYYASIDAVDRLKPEGLAEVSSDNWWREVIVLAVAQEKDPSYCLQVLFQTSPLMAALAVAECPTPSLDMQERAIIACVEGIDAEDGASRAAAISLLRKVVSQQESTLCTELEKRLESPDSKIASAVALVLATAGSSAASQALANHPRVWDKCLESAGYLSSTFENLLIDWIKGGADDQSKYAADLICKRLSEDRFEQLINLLPKLTAARADYVARILLTGLCSQGRPFSLFGVDENTLRKISKCTPFVKDPKAYITFTRDKITPQQDESVFSAIAAALYIRKNGQPAPSDNIFNNLVNAQIWSADRACLLCWLASGLILLYPQGNTILGTTLLATTLIIFLFALVRPYILPPWIPGHLYHSPRTLIPLTVLAAGALSVLVMGATVTGIWTASAQPWTFLSLSLSYSLTGLLLVARRGPFIGRRGTPVAVPLMWSSAITILICLRVVLQLPFVWRGVIALCFLGWLFYILSSVFIGWLRIRGAQKLMVQSTKRYLTDSPPVRWHTDHR